MSATRVDRKYLLPDETLLQVLEANRDLWIPDTVSGLDVQRYETEYFDTPDLQLFHAGRLQRPVRSKVRIRHYLDTGDHFIEVKTRNARGETTKVRQPWTGSFTEFRPFLEASLGAAGVLIDQLVPMARTAYERSAAVLVSGGRMTVDRELRVGRHDALTHHLHDDRFTYVILETKSPDQSPTAIDRFLWDSHIRPVSLSKYAMAIASFRPELPMNRWTRAATHLRPIATASIPSTSVVENSSESAVAIQ